MGFFAGANIDNRAERRCDNEANWINMALAKQSRCLGKYGEADLHVEASNGFYTSQGRVHFDSDRNKNMTLLNGKNQTLLQRR
jgi:hypothetical protein